MSSWVPLPARDRFESRCRVPAHCVLALALVVNPFSKYRFSFTADGTSLWHSPRFALELLQLVQVADPSPVSGRRHRVAGEDVEFDQVDRGRDLPEVRVFVWCCRQPGGGGVVSLIHESSDLESQECDSIEELAAYAPLLAEGDWASMSSQVSSRVEVLRREVDVRLVKFGGQEVLLCSRRKKRTEAVEVQEISNRDLDNAARGVSRILTMAAA